MTTRAAGARLRGFALVLTLSLLALMVVVLYAFSLLVRVGGQISTVTAYQRLANQHARLGLLQALGDLQTRAGRDDRVTAMAGIAGEPGGSQRRHWCGVWTEGGTFLGWLTSGASPSPMPGFMSGTTVAMVEKGSVGPTSTADKEFVPAGRIAIIAPGSQGPTTRFGAYAYWVGDEGVKLSAWAPAARLPSGGIRIGITNTPANIARLGQAYQDNDAENADRILSYEQSTALSYAPGSKLTEANLRDGFHHVTHRHQSVARDGAETIGRVNLNTTSVVVWRSVLETYERVPGASPFGSTARRTAAAEAISGGMAASASEKSAYAPFLSEEAFFRGDLLKSALAGIDGIEVEKFKDAMSRMLAVRSDTFRIRAYGEATNPLDPSRVEAVAYCEAIVQRTPAAAPQGQGRAFVVSYFRWLGPDDI